MSAFHEALRERNPDRPGTRRWVYVPYDQLSDRFGPLAETPPSELGIVMVENPAKADRRPYHKQKLALVLASGRHFALEQAARGVAVVHRVATGSLAATLEEVAGELGPLEVQRPAERELRAELASLFESGTLVELPHEGWLTTEDEFTAACGDAPPWRMDSFYRAVRRRTGVLMVDGKPEGGRFSFDGENRKPWKGEPAAPPTPTFRPDGVTTEVCEMVEEHYADHPGRLDPRTIPASKAQVRRLWSWALSECLPLFGPFEDAMSTRSRSLFHTRISPLLNINRITAAEVLEDVLGLEGVPLPSQEGFVRQVLGWREFVRHVHEQTDGFREIPEVGANPSVNGHAAPSFLEAHLPLPPVFWGESPSGLHCLDHTVEQVWDEGYSHHITRLMVLANWGTLLDVSPRELTDWFWAAYVDAYDWVVEPNVLAMGTFATGEVMTTKPYVSGSAYVNRMSDFCGACAFDPKKDCPMTRLYWAFLARNAERLEGNQRVSLPLRNVAKRKPAEREKDRETFESVRAALERGERLR